MIKNEHLGILTVAIVVILCLIYVKQHSNTFQEDQYDEEFQSNEELDSVPKEENVSEEKTEPIQEPNWIDWSPIKNVNQPLGKVLKDIESHLPNNHQYYDKDKIVWAHEATHGINSNIRNSKNEGRWNGFYTLNNRAILIKEPSVTIKQVADIVPEELKGPSYNLYLIQQRRDWDDCPLYLFDEWTAYTNGSECGIEGDLPGWKYSLFQAHNFNVYCLCLAMILDENYNDEQFKLSLIWNINRTFELYELSKNKKLSNLSGSVTFEGQQVVFTDLSENMIENYLKTIKECEGGAKLRVFMKNYLGSSFCKKHYNF